MRHIFILAFILSGLLYSGCESDEVNLAGSTFGKSELVKIKSLRVFSSAGEETNPIIIKRFTEDTFNLSANIIPQFNYYIIDSIAMGKSSAIVRRYNKEFTFDLKHPQNIILTARESQEVCCTTGETFTRSLPYFAGVLKPIVDFESVESSLRGFFVFSFTGKERLLLTQHGNTLSVPCLQMAHHNPDRGVAKYFMNNKLEPSFTKKLQPGDTVSVIEVSFQLKRL